LGDLDGAQEHVRRAQELAEASGATREFVFVGATIADFARRNGDVETSRAMTAEILDRLETLPSAHPLQGHGVAVTLAIMARHDLLDGEYERAAERLAEAHRAALGTKDMPIIAAVGTVGAIAAHAVGDPVDAAVRLGAAARLRGSGDPTHPDIAALTSVLTAQLGEPAFDAAFARGLAASRDEAIELLTPVGQARRL
jgi:hypothetical protein